MGMCVEEGAALEGKMGKKLKNIKKCEANAPKEVRDSAGVPNGLEDGFELGKKDRREKKDKKKAEISSDVELDGACNEDINVQDYGKVDDRHLKEKEKEKKKKKRTLEPVEDNDKSNNEIHMGREERRCLQTDDGKDFGKDSEFKARKEKKKRHKEDRSRVKNESLSSQSQMEILKDKDIVKDEVAKEQKSSQEDNVTEMKNAEEQTDEKNNNNNNKKRRRDEEVGDCKGKKDTTAGEEVGKVKENYVVDGSEKAEKKRKREKKKGKDDLGAGVREMMAKEQGNESTMIEKKDFGDSGGNAHSTRNKTIDREAINGNKEPNSVETGSEDPIPKMKSKKVGFSGHVEVFPSSDGPSKGKEKGEEEGLVQGKRFSPQEDEMIKEAVFNYIEAHGLGEEGLNMILRCKTYPKIKNCWKEIGVVLPHRPYNAIYYRAHTLFERDENRSWTTEELELVRKFHEEHGPKWKKLADAIGKYRVHLKDTWRRIKLPNMKKGHWSQEEYQTLFDLVNADLRMKAFEEKKSKHGMLRDNICWSAISDKLSTRTHPMCCMKWYNQLTSPMVGEGNWADVDDYRLLDALFSLDACCIEDVGWDNLLDHRSGDLCQKRWKQMVSHIGEHGNKSFAEQVEILSKRYCPNVLEAREAWDSKPVVS